MKTSCQELRTNKITLQFFTQSNCPFYNPTNDKKRLFFIVALYLKARLSTNECDRKTAFQSADLYEHSDTKRIFLKTTRTAQFKQSAYFLNRPCTPPASQLNLKWKNQKNLSPHHKIIRNNDILSHVFRRNATEGMYQFVKLLKLTNYYFDL